jgi:hypothetical protein
MIISDKLSNDETRRLVATLEKYRSVIGYSLKDLKRTSPSLCTHLIPIEQEHKPIREHQQQLNNAMREVVKKEVLKLLKVVVIYPISDSEWVSLGQVVLKKGGMTIIRNEKNELISQRTVTSWRMCIDYESSTKLLGKIISYYPSLMTCWRGWLTTPSSATWMVTLVIIRSRSIRITRVRPPSHVHMALSHTGECHLDYVMLQHHFKGA